MVHPGMLALQGTVAQAVLAPHLWPPAEPCLSFTVSPCCLHHFPAARLEASKLSLEAEIKEMRKAAKEEMSELKLEQNCAKQAAYEIREAAERRQQQLSETLAAAEARCSELEETAAGVARAAEAAQRSVAKLERQLGELQAEHVALQEAHSKVSVGEAQQGRRVVAVQPMMPWAM